MPSTNLRHVSPIWAGGSYSLRRRTTSAATTTALSVRNGWDAWPGVPCTVNFDQYVPFSSAITGRRGPSGVGSAALDPGDEAAASGLGLVALEVEACAFEVVAEQVDALGLLARLDTAVVHALVADQVAQEGGRLGGGVFGARRHARDPRPVRKRERPCRSACRPHGGARRVPRARGARGGRTSRSRPSRPSASVGTARVRAPAHWRGRGRPTRRRGGPCAPGGGV